MPDEHWGPELGGQWGGPHRHMRIAMSRHAGWRHEPPPFPGEPWEGRPPGPPPGPGFGHARHRFAGFAFRPRPRVGRGDIRAALLRLLAEQPMHGYQLMQRIAERSGGIWQPNPGSVYPTLQALEDEGLVRAEQQEGRRVFQLTDAGRAYVEAHQGELAAAWDAVVGTVDEGVLDLHERFRQLGGAVAQLADAGTAAQVVEAGQLLDRARRQLYRILAQDEPAAEAPDASEAGPR